jgi:putative Mg2+ transporter-C (MgtC) family protein
MLISKAIQCTAEGSSMDYIEILTRLGLATLAGGVIGLNRDLHGKPTGIRTLGIVSLGSAMIVIASMNLEYASAPDWSAVSRVIQGVITGIGFLGVGAMVRQSNIEVQGLTPPAPTENLVHDDLEVVLLSRRR